MTTYRLMDGVSGRPGVGSSGTQPPAALSGPGTGNFLAGTGFQVTQGGMWLQGYWWWVPPSGDTGGQKFALWNPSAVNVATLVTGSVVTSGTLTAGAMNFVPLAAPVQLATGTPYIAATGWTVVAGFPDTQHQFGTAGPYVSGIVNGPLTGYSSGPDGASVNPNPVTNVAQGLFDVSTNDPAAKCPFTDDQASNFWVDIQVSDTAPAGFSGSWRLWPGSPFPQGWTNDTANNFTLATEFTLSQPCALNKIWFYSPAGTTQLPTECGVWGIAGQSLVPGTDNASPSWSGAAGSGWVSCSYSGVTLAAGVKYKVAVFNGAGTPAIWNATTNNYWQSPGPGVSGIISGPVSAPNTATATSPGQDTFNLGTPFTYPLTFATGVAPNYWVDAEVTPAQAAPLVQAIPGRTWLRRFRRRQAPQAAAAAVTAQIATAPLAGAGAVTAVATQVPGATLAGAGAATAVAAQAAIASAAATGAVTAVAAQAAGASLAGAGTVTAAATQAAAAAAAGAGVVSAVVTQAVTVSLAGAGAVTATGTVSGGTVSGTAALAGAGSVTGKAAQSAGAALAGAGTLTALAVQAAAASLAAAGQVTAAGGIQAPFTVGRLTASDQPGSQLTAATAAQGALTVSTAPTEGP